MKITILGAGKSGRAAAALAQRKGHQVFLSEYSSIDKFQSNLNEIEELEIDFEFGEHSFERILESDLIVSSPGIPPSAEVIIKAEEAGIEIISEVEFAYRHLNGNPIIGVTGTNGKTTVVNLIHYIFQFCGKESHLAGNVGTPLSTLVDNIKNDDIIVLELSSYQLDRCSTLKCDTAIILNITEDHLPYHGGFQQYINAKWKITTNMHSDNLLVLVADDNTLNEQIFVGGHLKSKANKAVVTTKGRGGIPDGTKCGVFLEGEQIKFISGGNDCLPGSNKEEILMAAEQLAIPGMHNLYNSMAAAVAARRYEIRNEDIRDALTSFKGVEHRMEEVRSVNNVLYVNDSKATNVNAAWYALTSYNRPIIWIAGGVGDNDYSILDKVAHSNVKAIVTLGEQSEEIFQHFCLKMKCDKAVGLDDAVNIASEIAEEGDVVLFSPACKSFDMFTNFEERGQAYKSLVRELSD